MIIIPSLKTLATVCKNNRHCLGKQPPLFGKTTAVVFGNYRHCFVHG